MSGGADARLRWAQALIYLTPALWVVNYLVARAAPGVIGPHLLALLRWLIACVLFALPARHALWRQRHRILADWRHHLVLGALGMWICGAWVYLGGQTTSALNIALIYAVSPVLIAAASALWLGEQLRRAQMLGVVLALAGMLHVVLRGQWDALAGVQFVPGDGWIVGAMLAWTLYSLLLKKWPSPLEPGARLAVISLAGVLVLLPFAAWETWHGPLPALTWPGLGLALAAALFPGFGAYYAYALVQRELGAAKVGVVLYLGPIYTAVVAWLLLGETLHGFHAVGMALVLPGIYLVTRPQE